VADVRIEGDTLVVALTKLEKAEALHGDVRVPLSSVAGVDVLDRPLEEIHGLRAPGLGIPGRTAVGTWRSRDGKMFVVEHDRSRAVRLRLRDQPYREIIVGSDEPETVAEMIRAALGTTGGAWG
jgi:hypothetical protein